MNPNDKTKAAAPSPTDTAPWKPTYKFPAAEALANALLGNLTANNANPDAIEEARDARDIARASDVTDGELTTEEQSPEPPSEPSANSSTSNENPNRLTPEQRDEAISTLVELIRDGVIQNTQFKIDQ